MIEPRGLPTLWHGGRRQESERVWVSAVTRSGGLDAGWSLFGVVAGESADRSSDEAPFF